MVTNKTHVYKRLLLILFIGVMLVCYQNCGSSFSVENAVQSSSSSGSDSGGSGGGSSSATKSSYVTSSQAIGSASTAKTLTFDLGTSGAQVKITVTSYSDSSVTAYYFTAPTVVAPSGKDVTLSGLRVWLNGSEYGDGTTFSDYSDTVAAGTTTQISKATMVLQPDAGVSTSDTLALGFDYLSVGDEVLSSSTDLANGEALYQTYCAACHGSLATSTKRGTTASAIKDSFTTVSTMAYLANELSDSDINDIVEALK